MNTLPFHISHFHDRPKQLTAVKYKRAQSWISLNWSDYQAYICNVSSLLKEYGLNKGDRVAIFSSTRFEWAICDLACLCLGLVTVPIYGNSSPEDIELILKETSPKLIFLGDQEQFEQIPSSFLNNPDVFMVTYDSVHVRGSKTIETLNEEINRLNESSKSFSHDVFLEQCRSVDLDQTASIVYTSGTSGQPKGVVLTHGNIISELTDLMTAFPIASSDTTLSFLPYAHILGRVEMWLSAYSGFTLAFAESPERLKINLLEIQPTVLIAVPRIFEKVHAAVLSKLSSSRIADVAKSLEQMGFIQSLASAPLRLFLKNHIEKKLSEAFGGKLKYAISGGAPLPKAVAEFFRDNNVPLFEGYGLTETTGAICVNTPGDNHFGTVGKPLSEVKIKIANDGEILVKSAKVCRRYFNSQHGSPLDSDGYFHTGDIGELTSDGFLRITDRKKDLIKTSGGKYVAPQRIEGLLKRNPLISQVLVLGDQRKFIGVLITLDQLELKAWAIKNKVPFAKVQDLNQSQRVYTEVERLVKETNLELASFETIKKFHILGQEFTVGSGELTPSLKVKRKAVEGKYKSVIDQLYGV